ncbi:hypothetical protein K438DRAFT_1588126 [Mycena galopus ATCC 62051]|nr:hypothetical protein K438DRAFT_1588126 [Mycena galopus ATCC 62051]
MNPSSPAWRRLYLSVLCGICVSITLSLYLIYSQHFVFKNTLDTKSSRLSTTDLDPWTPLSLFVCFSGMPSHYAPCAARTTKNVEYAEELIYPDFEIREPYFAQEEHRRMWRTFVQTAEDFDRGSLHSGWMQYKGQSGQNFVFRDVKYTPPFHADSWSGESCMDSLVATSPIQPLTSDDQLQSTFPTTLIALSPDSFSFQHFLDRVTHILVQGQHLPDPTSTPYVMTGKSGSGTVDQMWSQMGYPENRVLHNNPSIAAQRLIFSCRVPLIHPWLSHKTLDSLGVPRTSPTTTRNKVVYMSRSHGGAVNPGRRVINEDSVLRAITTLLDQRGRGEELVMFNPDNFQNISQLFSWFSDNALAVVGPHGGAMVNHRWANKDTFVLEFMPQNRIALMNFEEASLLSQTYAAIIVEPLGIDMHIDLEDVISLLRQHLGVVGEDPLRKTYAWRAKELGFS